MPKLVFLDDAGIETVLHAVPGNSVMETATENDLPGILGDCGGKLVCGTCHVVVDDGPWAADQILPDEDDMLDYTATPRGARSRLSCQLVVTEACDGSRLRLPATQEL